MSQFGKRNSNSSGSNTNSVKNGHAIRKKTFKARSENSEFMITLLRPAFLGIGLGSFLFIFFNVIIGSFLQGEVHAQMNRRLEAPFMNDDMYTGVHERKRFITWDQEEKNLTPGQRHAWSLEDRTIEACYSYLKPDLDELHKDDKPFEEHFTIATYEPKLYAMGIYLPCLMNKNRERFCNATQKKEIIKRLDSYFLLLRQAKKERKMNQNKEAKEPTEKPKDILESFEPDRNIVNAMRDLAKFGYINKSDFSNWFGLSTPKHINEIIGDIKSVKAKC